MVVCPHHATKTSCGEVGAGSVSGWIQTPLEPSTSCLSSLGRSRHYFYRSVFHGYSGRALNVRFNTQLGGAGGFPVAAVVIPSLLGTVGFPSVIALFAGLFVGHLRGLRFCLLGER
jgi:hypothetical protein